MKDVDFDELVGALENELLENPKQLLNVTPAMLIARILHDVSKSLEKIAENTAPLIVNQTKDDFGHGNT